MFVAVGRIFHNHCLIFSCIPYHFSFIVLTEACLSERTDVGFDIANINISFDSELRSSVTNVQFSRLVYLKNQTDWTAVNRDLAGIQWSGIYRSDNPIDMLNDTLVSIIRCRVPTKVIKRRMKDKAWFDEECRSAYQDKQEAYGLWSHNRSPLLGGTLEDSGIMHKLFTIML